MADSLLSFGVEKLWDLLVRESERFQGVQEQFDGLKSEVKMLRCFLEDADAKKHTSATVRNVVKDIKEIVYDAEDIIETFLLKEELEKTSGIKKRIRKLACVIADQRRIAFDMEALSNRITKVIRDMQILSVQKVIVNERDTQERQRVMRQTFSSDNEDHLVGLEKNVDQLVGYLVEEDSSQVVSVTGMGGIGKTTLARQVFNHETVKSHFAGLAWVCVSQQFTRKYVWQTILRKLRPEYKESEMTEDELQEKLVEVLEQQNTLIVLDDIWREEDWSIIKPIFPRNKGWKVLLTSRNEGVGLRADPKCFTFKQDCLTPEESWTLFQRIAFPSKNSIEHNADKEMEEIGKQMIKHCGGLPLAVRVLGGLLATKYTQHYWKQVSENIASHLVGGRTNFNDDKSTSFNYILSLSFEELPISLKRCFLYLAHFLEDHEINVEDLSLRWAADGIFEPRHYDGETIRDVGDSYMEELVQRNMVISERDVTSLRSETCRLHDMMRDICLLKAKEENFLHIASNLPSTANSQPSFTCRRFVSHNAVTLDVERDVNNPKLRSLVVVPVNDSRWKLSGSSFKRLELLRVLDLFNAKFEGGKLPSGIGKLIHLRYLSLKYAYVTHLPASLGNLLLLIYLNLDIFFDSLIFVPNVLMGMQELRYLTLPMSMNEKTKLELSKLVKLETLKSFSTRNSSIEDLRVMVRLRSLRIRLAKKTCIETVSALIGGLRYLEDLEIRDIWSSKRNIKEEIVWDFSHLKRLRLRMYIPNLLKEQHFPSHLTILSLEECGLEEDPMPILEKLLQLKEVSLRIKSFIGRRMVCSGGGFRQLQKLEFSHLKEWEEWKVEEGSMPLLHTLSIWGCNELKELPDGLRFITSLKELHIIGAFLEFKEKLSREGEDYYKVQHIPLLNIN